MTSELRSWVISQSLAQLQEAVVGPPGPGSWFAESRPDAGILGTIKNLSAADASRQRGDSSIAAHVNHVVFSLEASAGWIRGEREERDWASSWRVSETDETAWHDLQARLQARYDDLCRVLQDHAVDSDEAVGGAIAAVAHMAYHLGAIRQKVAFAGAQR